MTAATDDGADGYRAIGEWYDAEHDAVVDDVALYLQLAEVVGDPILELGCGSGRVLAALAAAGHRVAGVDRSAAMLDRARARLADIDGPPVELLLSEMDSLPQTLAGRHGLVILSHNTLLHATSSVAQRAVLSAARAALDPRGMLVLDLINPIVDVAHGEDGMVIREGTWPTAGGGAVSKFSSRTVERSSQRIATDIWYDHVGVDGRVVRTATHLDLRFVSAPELLLMLESCGFVEPQLYGSYDLDPYQDTSPRLVVTAEATPSGRPDVT